MNKNKLLSCFLGFLLFSSGGKNVAHGTDCGLPETKKERIYNYHLMVVSRYFETIDDFINLELATPKARDNMEKFHYNPIALDQWSRQFFTSLETLHVYNETDEHFIEEEFYKRVIWYPYVYTKERAKHIAEDKKTTYHNLVFTREFVRDSFRGRTEILVGNWPEIGDKATKVALDNKCFSFWWNISRRSNFLRI